MNNFVSVKKSDEIHVHGLNLQGACVGRYKLSWSNTVSHIYWNHEKGILPERNSAGCSQAQ